MAKRDRDLQMQRILTATTHNSSKALCTTPIKTRPGLPSQECSLMADIELKSFRSKTNLLDLQAQEIKPSQNTVRNFSKSTHKKTCSLGSKNILTRSTQNTEVPYYLSQRSSKGLQTKKHFVRASLNGSNEFKETREVKGSPGGPPRSVLIKSGYGRHRRTASEKRLRGKKVPSVSFLLPQNQSQSQTVQNSPLISLN